MGASENLREDPDDVATVVEVQDVRLEPGPRRAWRGNREIRLSPKEFDLLYALITRAGDVVSRDELIRDVWGATLPPSTRTLDVHLAWVRSKLGDDARHPTLIRTIRGRGHQFETGTGLRGPCGTPPSSICPSPHSTDAQGPTG